MRTKSNKIITLIAIGAATLISLPAYAGRGGNSGGSAGFAGECPQGLVPGTRNTQDCTRPADGTGAQSRYGASESGNPSGNGTRQAKRDGSGSGSGNRNGGSGQKGKGSGNAGECPLGGQP